MEQIRFTLRIPVELHDQLKCISSRNKRSLNSQIIFMLDLSVDCCESNCECIEGDCNETCSCNPR